MKRRNFLKTLIGAAAAVAVPASLLKKLHGSAGATFTHDGTGFAAFFAKTHKFTPYPYQREAIRQMEFYGAGAARVFPRHVGKTYWLQLGNAMHAEVEKRVLAQLAEKPDMIERILNTIQKQA